MTDQTIDAGTHRYGYGSKPPTAVTPFTAPGDDGFFHRPADGFLRTLADDFRAVPPEAWVVLAGATILSNLFIALA